MTYQQNILCERLYSGKSWHTLNESNCAVIDVLVKEFGDNKVYGGWRDPNGCVTGDKSACLEKIYDVLNFILFGNALKKPMIDSISQIEAVNVFGNDKLGQYAFNVECDMKNGNLIGMQIVPNSSKICLVLDEMEAPFMFVVNQLCHQMIHQYIFEVGDGLQQIFQALVDEKEYDIHQDQFQKIMEQLNKDTGLLIEDDYGPIVVSFIESTYKARTMNDEYEGKEELGLYDGMDSIRTDFLDDEKGSIPENEDEYIGDYGIADAILGVLHSSTYVNVKQKSPNTIQINIT